MSWAKLIEVCTEFLRASHKCEVIIGVRSLAHDETYDEGDYLRDSFEWDFFNDESSYYSTEPIKADGTYCFGTYIDVWDDKMDIEVKLKGIVNVLQNALYVRPDVLIGGCFEGDKITGSNEEMLIQDAVVLSIFQENQALV